ncbi:hypothetical protein DXA97_13920 [Clostridium sp. OF09-36]|uniref:hypothetical protein n=1 Tax=Clostridium sp. OF09-36 TaxID=2292310 RepID=UPI000E4964B1|nr:hypothetical protein [Clostridium sp. OF09-36]RHV86283.1 hypothetical protein DXA97_13920 [Clostridium sp. OF09-36]
MNRLTQKRVNGIKTGYWSASKRDELVARLAEYEDTGLAPVEVLKLKQNTVQWIPMAKELPESADYVLMSFENFSLPAIGRYEVNDEGDGAWYLGDDNGGDTCCSVGLFVNAWMPLPNPYTAVN